MTPIGRHKSDLDFKGERLLHLKWILSCLDPGAVARIDEPWFVSLFGLPCSGAFAAAIELARDKACVFAYDPGTGTATFQRLSALNNVQGEGAKRSWSLLTAASANSATATGFVA